MLFLMLKGIKQIYMKKISEKQLTTIIKKKLI